MSGVALGLLYAAIVLSDEPAEVRSRRINTTLGEITHGNYYAWAQVWMWSDKLTTQEKYLLKDACAEYSRSNRFLHLPATPWPPAEVTRPRSAFLTWARSVLEMDDRALPYDRIIFQVTQEVPVAKFEPMFRDPTKVTGGEGPRPGHGLAIRSPANPGQ